MWIRLLGPFVVEGATGPIAVRSARQRAVLAALALHAGQPVPVTRLVDAVWPDDPPASARNSLQSHVTRLRTVLGGPDVIRLEPAGYRLAIAPECVDALRFEELVRDRRGEEALALWRGTPLPEFPDEPFRGWAIRLAEARRTALVLRADALAAGGRADEAVAGLAPEVDADPCWEPGTLALARALAAADRRGDAAAVLRRHADAVVDSLGMDPSPQIKRLQVALLRGVPLSGPEPAARPGAPAEAGVPPRDSAARVPLRFSSFVGRDAEQARLAHLLAEPGLVSVVGPGGVGKTRLVAETVRAGSRVAWVDAADVRGRDDFLQAVAVGIGARLGPQDEPLTAIAQAATRQAPIVVLDNCEHLLDPAAEVAEALLPARTVSATSRVLPTPPGPTTDTRPGSASRCARRACSASRPTKDENRRGTRAAVSRADTAASAGAPGRPAASGPDSGTPRRSATWSCLTCGEGSIPRLSTTASACRRSTAAASPRRSAAASARASARVPGSQHGSAPTSAARPATASSARPAPASASARCTRAVRRASASRAAQPRNGSSGNSGSGAPRHSARACSPRRSRTSSSKRRASTHSGAIASR